MQHLVLESIKSVTKISYHQLSSVTIKKVAYVAQRKKFVTKLIVNVAMLTRLDGNVSKKLFLDINVSKNFMDQIVNNFLLEEFVSNFIWT